MELVCTSALIMVIVLGLYLLTGGASADAATGRSAEPVRLLRVRPYAPSTPDHQPVHVLRRHPASGDGERPRGPGPQPVQREILPLYQEKGWQKDGRTYRGFFRAHGRRYPGEIHEPHPGLYQVYISNPPVQQLKRHPHGPCFMPQGGGQFKVHLDHTPRDVDHVIASVETILKEALGGR